MVIRLFVHLYAQTVSEHSLQYTLCLKTRTPVTFRHKFIETALISIILGILGIENLSLVPN